MESEDPKVIPFSRANNRGKKSKGPSLAARTGIGAAAAAVILLIAVFNMPKSLPGADLDMSSQLMSGGAANSSMSTESSADAPQADGQNNSGGSSELRKMDQATPSESADVNLKSAPPAPSEGADQPAAAGGGMPSDKVPAVSEAPISNRAATSPPADRPKSTKKADSRSAEPQSTTSSAPTQENIADDKAAAGDERMAPTSAPTEGALSLMAAQASWTSPDGQHMAEMTGQHVVIYSLTAEGEEQQRTVLTSLPLEGTGSPVCGRKTAPSSLMCYSLRTVRRRRRYTRFRQRAQHLLHPLLRLLPTLQRLPLLRRRLLHRSPARLLPRTRQRPINNRNVLPACGIC